MARYQLRRPSPVKVFPRRVRRQDPGVIPSPEEEEEEGPESPDSPFSSPSTIGALSESEDSESEDEGEEPASPVGGGQGSNETEPASPSLPIESQNPSFEFSHVSHASTFTAASQVTGGASVTGVAQPSITSTSDFSSHLARPSEPTATGSPLTPAESETAGQPQRSSPQEERSMITKGAAAAAITLSVLGKTTLLTCLEPSSLTSCRRHSSRRSSSYSLQT